MCLLNKAYQKISQTSKIHVSLLERPNKYLPQWMTEDSNSVTSLWNISTPRIKACRADGGDGEGKINCKGRNECHSGIKFLTEHFKHRLSGACLLLQDTLLHAGCLVGLMVNDCIMSENKYTIALNEINMTEINPNQVVPNYNCNQESEIPRAGRKWAVILWMRCPFVHLLYCTIFLQYKLCRSSDLLYLFIKAPEASEILCGINRSSIKMY